MLVHSEPILLTLLDVMMIIGAIIGLFAFRFVGDEAVCDCGKDHSRGRRRDRGERCGSCGGLLLHL